MTVPVVTRLRGTRNNPTRQAESESTSPSLPVVFLSNHGILSGFHCNTLANFIFSTIIHALEDKDVMRNSRRKRISNVNSCQTLVNSGNFFHMTLKVPDRLLGGHLNVGF